MPRKRQLDPEFFSDEEMAEFLFEARLFYQGTWCYCEDTGTFEVKHKTLKAQIFPYDVLDTKPLYEKLRDNGKYIEYSNNGKIYAFIKGFHKRQTIQWPSSSYFPLPPEPFVFMIPESIRKRNKYSLNTQSALTEPSRRIEKNRIEKNRIELNEEELENLKKIYKKTEKDQKSLERHLKIRGFEENHISNIVKQVFANIK